MTRQSTLARAAPQSQAPMSDPAHPTPDGIRAAYAAIDPVFLDTPLLHHPATDVDLTCTLAVKVETQNPTRAFKGRGTDWFLTNLPAGSQRLDS